MRRIAIVIALGLLLALAVAAPALGYQAHKAPTPGEAYVFPMSGTDYWWEVTADGGWIENFGIPIPSNYPVYVCFGWVSPIRGTVVALPKNDFYAIDITNADGDSVWSVSASDAVAKWSNVWKDVPGPAFNKANATYWARDWYVLMDLPKGSYTGTTTETVRRMITDSSFDWSLLPDPDADWARHLQQRPFKVPPGQYDWTFAFTIGE